MGVNVETVDGAEIPGAADGRFVVDEYVAPRRANGCGVEVEGAKERGLCGRCSGEVTWRQQN